MNRSTKYNFYLPQNTDLIDPSDFDYNFEIIDANLITESQTFTDTQKSTARTNIGAASAADLGSKSSASSVTGDDAFSKINTLKSNLNNNTYVSTGLTTNNCSIVYGGYVTIGNLIIVNIRFTISGTGATISGFPAPQINLGFAGYDTAQEKTWYGYMNTSGQLITPNAYGSTGTIMVSFVYAKA